MKKKEKEESHLGFTIQKYQIVDIFMCICLDFFSPYACLFYKIWNHTVCTIT